MLELPPGAESAEIKQAFYALSKRFHPDRFFGKALGSFRARVEWIFKRVTEAQAVLTDPTRRAAWLERHPEMAPPPPVPGARGDERKARLQKHPYLARFARVALLVARGREAMDRGEFARASGDLHLAIQLDPKNQEAIQLLSEAKRAGDLILAESAAKEARTFEVVGDLTRALGLYRDAVALDPENADWCHRAVLLLERGGPDLLKEALHLARRAVDLAPDQVGFRASLADLQLRAGLHKNAAREYEAILRQRPDDAHAKEQLRRLKWRF